MLAIAGVMSTLLGFVFGVILVVTEKGGLYENLLINRILDFIVNMIRSFPFIILMISIIPFTRLIAGTSIGETAALVPLTVACTPFMARIFQNSFKEVDPALIEAAQSFGASKWQIVFKVMLKESVPSIISGLCLAIINLLGCTAMAGAIGAGGLGAVALQYGYQSFNLLESVTVKLFFPIGFCGKGKKLTVFCRLVRCLFCFHSHTVSIIGQLFKV
jgi:D-methionine transport system permease protein